MRGIGAMLLVGSLVAVCFGGCAGSTTSSGIPAGAHQVHVTATATDVHLDPSTVSRGDVYLVLDIPDGTTVILVSSSPNGTSTGPLTDDAVTRVAHGDMAATLSDALSVGGDSALRARMRGQVGFGGNVYKRSLAAGKYAFLLPAPEGSGGPISGASPISVAVLTVTP
jgi:hypothetical protein